MKNELMSFLFVGSGSIGILNAFVDFANTYFVAISFLFLIISAIYKIDRVIKTKEYMKTHIYSSYRRLKTRLIKKNVKK